MLLTRRNCLFALSACSLWPVGIAKAADAESDALIAAYNASGQALLEALAKAPGNLALSPYSIGTAMSMVRSGAAGQTLAEMSAALRLTLSAESADAANAGVFKVLKSYDRSDARTPEACPPGRTEPGGGCKPGPVAAGRPGIAKLSIANALMLGKSGSRISEAFRDRMRASYDAELHAGATLESVNDWVKQKTEGKIPRLLDTLDADSAAVILNAVYFKAAWQTQFVKSATRDADFQLSRATKIRVPMMRQQSRLQLLDRPAFQAIALSYEVPELEMLIVRPRDVAGAESTMKQLSEAGALRAMFDDLGKAPAQLVSLELPRFKVSYSADLMPPFKMAGMKIAFTDAADFSGMSGKPAGVDAIKIGQIKHRALVEVDEYGTEAAAATAIAMYPARAMPRPETPIPFVVDRPFLFFLLDRQTGAVLFSGRVADPRAKP